jgi:hypothetical protein
MNEGQERRKVPKLNLNVPVDRTSILYLTTEGQLRDAMTGLMPCQISRVHDNHASQSLTMARADS